MTRTELNQQTLFTSGSQIFIFSRHSLWMCWKEILCWSFQAHQRRCYMKMEKCWSGRYEDEIVNSESSSNSFL